MGIDERRDRETRGGKTLEEKKRGGEPREEKRRGEEGRDEEGKGREGSTSGGWFGGGEGEGRGWRCTHRKEGRRGETLEGE